MKFADLVAAKDAAVAHDEECAAAEESMAVELERCQAKHAAATEARLAAHKSIHDILVEFGEHYLVDDDGTLTVFKPIDESIAPGYLAVQPIPGAGPVTVTESKKK